MSNQNAPAVKKRSVGLVVFTRIDGVAKAILQRRGPYDFEKMKPQSWPGACQITVHGQVTPEDTDIDAALKREAEEEIGKQATLYFYFTSGNPFRLVSQDETPREHVATFTALVSDPNFLKLIRLESSSGGLVLVTRDQADSILDLASSFTKDTGVTTPGVIAMFGDEKKALIDSFDNPWIRA